jgi:hypothetical protein
MLSITMLAFVLAQLAHNTFCLPDALKLANNRLSSCSMLGPSCIAGSTRAELPFLFWTDRLRAVVSAKFLEARNRHC